MLIKVYDDYGRTFTVYCDKQHVPRVCEDYRSMGWMVWGIR